MSPSRGFDLVYAPNVIAHLRAIERKYHSLIRSRIEEQLRFEPDVETKNRKPLKRSIAYEEEWEIRFGPGNRFRVFYQVDQERQTVYILAIGEKRRKRLFIGGEEVDT